MKQKLQGLISGLLIGATLTGGVAIAANTTTLYDVLTTGIKIVVDGRKINPTDANGNPVEPMIYNGTTYLPVRAVADALGKPVYWDGPNYTVYLGNTDGALEYPTVYLDDLISISDPIHTGTKNASITDNYGNRYDCYADDGDNGDCKLEYLLNMKYSCLKGTLYVPQGENRDGSGYIQVIADGKTIYTSPELNKTSHPLDINVNLKGSNDVVIQYATDNITLCLGNAGFYQ